MDVDTSLTLAEVQLLGCLAHGMKAEDAARYLNVSERTLRLCCGDLCRKLGVDYPLQAVTWARQRDLL